MDGTLHGFSGRPPHARHISEAPMAMESLTPGLERLELSDSPSPAYRKRTGQSFRPDSPPRRNTPFQHPSRHASLQRAIDTDDKGLSEEMVEAFGAPRGPTNGGTTAYRHGCHDTPFSPIEPGQRDPGGHGLSFDTEFPSLGSKTVAEGKSSATDNPYSGSRSDRNKHVETANGNFASTDSRGRKSNGLDLPQEVGEGMRDESGIEDSNLRRRSTRAGAPTKNWKSDPGKTDYGRKPPLLESGFQDATDLRTSSVHDMPCPSAGVNITTAAKDEIDPANGNDRRKTGSHSLALQYLYLTEQDLEGWGWQLGDDCEEEIRNRKTLQLETENGIERKDLANFICTIMYGPYAQHCFLFMGIDERIYGITDRGIEILIGTTREEIIESIRTVFEM